MIALNDICNCNHLKATKERCMVTCVGHASPNHHPTRRRESQLFLLLCPIVHDISANTSSSRLRNKYTANSYSNWWERERERETASAAVMLPPDLDLFVLFPDFYFYLFIYITFFHYLFIYILTFSEIVAVCRQR